MEVAKNKRLNSLLSGAMDEELGTKPRVKKKKKDPVLTYVDNGQIKTTTLYTKDSESFIAWAMFVLPPLEGDIEYQKALSKNRKRREKFYESAYVNGQSVYTALFRSVRLGPVSPLNDRDSNT